MIGRAECSDTIDISYVGNCLLTARQEIDRAHSRAELDAAIEVYRRTLEQRDALGAVGTCRQTKKRY